MPADLPSFLSVRAPAALAKRDAALKRLADAKSTKPLPQAPQPTKPGKRDHTPTPPSRATNPKTRQTQTTDPKAELAQTPQTKRSKKTAGMEKTGRGEQVKQLSRLQAERVILLSRRWATDQQALELAEDHLPEIFAAILHGAKVPGSSGDRDRRLLFRALGFPFAIPATGKPGAADGAGDVGDRLARALTRLERRLGRDPVAAPILDAEIVPPPNGSGGDEHKMDHQRSISTGLPEASAEEGRKRGGSGGGG